MEELKYLIIHCTDTKAAQKVTADDIRRWHTDPPPAGFGWKRVGYSDMIRRDGKVENLVPYDEDDYVQPGELTNGARGYNGCSRHVVLVGGRGNNGLPRNNFTPRQLVALKHYIAEFKRNHPGCKVIGHNEIAPKACPCLDVRQFLRLNDINDN